MSEAQHDLERLVKDHARLREAICEWHEARKDPRWKQDDDEKVQLACRARVQKANAKLRKIAREGR